MQRVAPALGKALVVCEDPLRAAGVDRLTEVRDVGRKNAPSYAMSTMLCAAVKLRARCHLSISVAGSLTPGAHMGSNDVFNGRCVIP